MQLSTHRAATAQEVQSFTILLGHTVPQMVVEAAAL